MARQICAKLYDNGKWICTRLWRHAGDCELERNPDFLGPHQTPAPTKGHRPTASKGKILFAAEPLPPLKTSRGPARYVPEMVEFWEWPVVNEGGKWITKRNADGTVRDDTEYVAQISWRVVKKSALRRDAHVKEGASE